MMILGAAKTLVQNALERFGYKITRTTITPDMDQEFNEIYIKCKNYTLTSKEMMYSLYQSVKYIVNCGISGDFVECGVWRGGSAMVIALTLLNLRKENRKIYLYDTFTGMTKPSDKDKQISDGVPAINNWVRLSHKDCAKWWFVPLEEVRRNLFSVGYPENNIIFVKGNVENTIPQIMPSRISLLRLDTDWYESTLHELKYFFPILSEKGVLIIDDYGHWAGAREATDKYISENKIPILLFRIDYAGRIGIKSE